MAGMGQTLDGAATPPLKLVAFDLDGVIYRGAEVLSGAAEALQAVTERGLILRFVTNNATLHRTAVAARLNGMGLAATPGQVLGSAAATAAWLQGHIPPGSRVLALGEAGLLQELREAGFQAQHVLPRPELGLPETLPGNAPVRAVAVGLDRALTYASLAAALQPILEGALFVATNVDATFPTEGRLLPGGGSIVAAVAAAAGRQPEVIGKPGLGMAEALARTTGVAYTNMLLVGDRLDTDIEMGLRAGMRTALVLTGVTQQADVAQSERRPDFVLPNLQELPGLLDRILAREA
ncbi:MAG: HAD-IIA family hydrolase [Gaiellales bacterium]|nr:HAD-IIA family hydrolase [Gaiellales bacterium]